MIHNVKLFQFVKVQFVFWIYTLFHKDKKKAGKLADENMFYLHMGSFFTFLILLGIYLFVGIPIAATDEELYDKIVLKLVLLLVIGLIYFLGTFLSSTIIMMNYRNWKSEEDRKMREEERRRQEEENKKKAEEFAKAWQEFEDLSSQYRERQRIREESERREKERQRRQQSNAHKGTQRTTVSKGKEYYLSVLGLPASTNHFKDVKKAYRQLMKTFHPDIYKGSDNKAKQIIEAYEKLQVYYS